MQQGQVTVEEDISGRQEIQQYSALLLSCDLNLCGAMTSLNCTMADVMVADLGKKYTGMDYYKTAKIVMEIVMPQCHNILYQFSLFTSVQSVFST